MSENDRWRSLGRVSTVSRYRSMYDMVGKAVGASRLGKVKWGLVETSIDGRSG